MLKIRLQRTGKKNSSSFKIVLTEHTTSPKGKFIELLGFYNPKLKTKKINKERVEYWLGKGAKASPTVHNFLVDEKIIQVEKIKAWKPKKKKGEQKAISGETTQSKETVQTENANPQAGTSAQEQETKSDAPIDNLENNA